MNIIIPFLIAYSRFDGIFEMVDTEKQAMSVSMCACISGRASAQSLDTSQFFDFKIFPKTLEAANLH